MMKNVSEQTALITGASSGIGYHMAREFASRGHPLVIVAPDIAELNRLAAEIDREFDVSVLPIAKDLTEEAAPQEIFTKLSNTGKSVSILVNNAGMGRHGKFLEIAPYDDIAMLRLNVEALVRLTRLFLPTMLDARQGRILNTASIAAFEPGPNLAIYHATKAFVLSFSESLATELHGTGVTLTALCPGPTDTDFFPKAHMLDTVAFQNANLMAPQDVAQSAYAALMNGERVFIPGVINKTMVAARRFLPESVQAKKNEEMYAEADETDRHLQRGDKEGEAMEHELKHRQ